MDLGAAAGLTTANWSSKLLPSKGKRYPIQIQIQIQSDQWTQKHENNE